MTEVDLYQTKDNRYGTKLTTNSLGEYVLEMKGEGGRVEAFNPTDLELVLPYSVRLKDINSSNVVHIHAKKDIVKVGDILLNDKGAIFVVEAVDVKVKSAQNKPVSFRRIPAEIITLGEA